MNHDDLLVRIAWLYYIENLTQQEIADRLNYPRIKITHLLQKARDKGIVEFRIAKPTAHLELERELCRQFALKDARVVAMPLSGDRLRTALGQAAAEYLQALLRPNLMVGLGMGRTLAEIPHFITRRPVHGCVFLEMVGGAGRNDLGFDTYNVSWMLAQRCGGVAEHVFTPVVVENAAARAALLQDSKIVSALEKAARCDVGLVGIGEVSEEMLLVLLGYCGAEVVRELRTKGAVGDIIGHFFDIQGRSVPYEIDDRLVALSLNQLQAIPTRIAVAGGLEKSEAIVGALRGAYVNVLITDAETAQAVLRKATSLTP